MLGKKKEMPNQEKLWLFNYMVEFIDGTIEDRIGEVKAIHMANAVGRAEKLIDDHTECDQSVSKVFMYQIELDEDEEVL